MMSIPPFVTRAFLLAALAFLASCSGPVLDPAGDIARQQRDIIYISTGLMLLIIVPVLVLIVVFAWRYRKGRGATYDPNFDHSTSLELAIWSAPLLIIIALGALTWSSTHLLDPFRPLPAKASSSDQKVLVVKVIALDWKWLFIYPEQGVATVNELALPVGRPVRFDMTSSNMMNTFYAPTLAGMLYVMPGMESRLHAILDRKVESEGFSANYSGAGFSDMRFKVYGLDQAGFDRWATDAKSGANELTLDGYRRLVAPSEKVRPMRFSSFDPDIYRKALERCIEPGTICMTDLMARGEHGGISHPPKTPESAPRASTKSAPIEPPISKHDAHSGKATHQ